MNPTVTAFRVGLARGRIELRQLFTAAPDLIGQFLTPAIALAVLYLIRDRDYADTGMSIAELALPGLIGSIVAFNGLFAITNVLVLDREDGTLLRAKTVPKGMIVALSGNGRRARWVGLGGAGDRADSVGTHGATRIRIEHGHAA